MMRYLVAVLLLGSILFFSCDFLKDDSAAPAYYDLDTTGMGVDQYDSIIFYAVEERPSDTTRIDYWTSDEKFPTRLYIPGSLEKPYSIITIGYSGDKITYARAFNVTIGGKVEDLGSVDIIEAFVPDTIPLKFEIGLDSIITAVKKDSLVLSVVVSGSPTRYRWYKGSKLIQDSSVSSLVFSSVSFADSGTYRVQASKSGKTAVSSTGRVVVFNDGYTVAISFSAGGTVSPGAAGSYIVQTGKNQRFDFAPDSGYYVQSVKVNGSTDAGAAAAGYIALDSVLSAQAISVSFARVKYTVSLSANDSTFGTVVYAPVKTAYYFGDTLSATASPLPSYRFSGWQGLNADSSTFELIIKADVNATALFSPLDRYSVIVLSDSLVTVTPVKPFYLIGDTVTIEASNAAGTVFSHWEVDGVKRTKNPYTFILKDDVTVEPFWNVIRLPVSFAVQPAGAGTVPEAPDSLSWGVSTKITAVPGADYIFSHWSKTSGKGSLTFSDSTDEVTSITLRQSGAGITAHFTQARFSVTAASSNPNYGSVSVIPVKSRYGAGDTVRLSATASTGYRFSGWSGLAGLDSSYEVIIVNQDIEVSGVFSPLDKFSVVVTASHGTVDVSPNDEFFSDGDRVTLTPTPATGFRFSNWLMGDSVITDSILSFTVSDDIVLEAVFSRITLAVSLSASPSGSGLPAGPGAVEWGIADTLKANPGIGFDFVTWEKASGFGTVSFDDPAAETTLFSVTVGPVNIRAVYTVASYNLTLSKNINGGSPSGPDSLKHSVSAAISANPSASYKFLRWTVVSGSVVFDDSLSEEASITVTGGDAEVRAVFEIKPSLGAVVFSRAAGRFNGSVSVSMSVPGSPQNTVIYYTENGSTPSAGSSIYVSALPVTSSTILSAVAYNEPAYLPGPISKITLVKNEAPTLSLSAPTLSRDSARVMASPYSFSGVSGDDSLISSFDAQVNNVSKTVNMDPSYNWDFSSSLNPFSWNKVELLVTDNDGSSGAKTFYVYYSASLSAPSAPVVDSTSSSAVFLSWSSSPYADFYIVYRSSDDISYTAIDTVSVLSFQDQSLAHSANYYYKLKAYKAAPGGFDIADSSAFSTSTHAVTTFVFDGFHTPSGVVDYGKIVRKAPDGGFYVAGHVWNGANRDIYLAHFDSTGGFLWENYFGTTGNDFCNDMILTNDGGFALTGEIDVPSYGTQAFLLKLDAARAVTFFKDYGGTGTEKGFALTEVNTGGFVITGSTTLGANDILVVRTDAAGDTLWLRHFGSETTDIGYSVIQHIGQGYFVIGGSSANKGYMLKVSTGGDSLLGVSFSNCQILRDVERTFDGGYIFTGRTSSFGNGAEDLYVLKTTNIGSITWENAYGGVGNDIGYSVGILSGNQGYYFAGTKSVASPDFYLVVTDNNGDTLWTRAVSGTGFADQDESYSAAQTTDGGFILFGTNNIFGTAKMYFRKYDKNGFFE